jgi:hypothetical protein
LPSPSPSPAMQSDVVGHEMAANQVPGSTSNRFQVAAPGRIRRRQDVTPAPTATHRLASGHDTDCMWVSCPNGGVSSSGPCSTTSTTAWSPPHGRSNGEQAGREHHRRDERRSS